MQKTTHLGKKFPTHIVIFLLPAVIIYTLFMVYPLIDSVRLSFYDQSASQPIFVGFDNFHTLLFTDPWSQQFWHAVANNFVFFSIHMLVQNPIALLLAALLTAKFLKGRSLYRTLIFTPTTLSVVVIGFIWQLMLNPTWGIFDNILRSVGLESLIQPWLGSTSTALVVISLISTWQFVGLPMLLFMAALVGIPDELIEAAQVDGA